MDDERIRNDIAQLYDMDRETRDKLADITARLRTLEDDKQDKQHSTGAILGIISAIIAAVAVIVAVVI